ncbi:uncharacterized protein N7515_004216 [Penicillium bovifimosum]|uniref:Uncharacterized protein n=1 Tax=Penicillium bovifimosum TaxID=126998 RepID=A0A9W9H6C2_9EURO|nr:uncharacterized protein N7515_004216 [Penicillium bovifimosum]KAJ5139368.1 hypothetical protein N7515_004216 [Penicillium bovifimosum]
MHPGHGIDSQLFHRIEDEVADIHAGILDRVPSIAILAKFASNLAFHLVHAMNPFLIEFLNPFN